MYSCCSCRQLIDARDKNTRLLRQFGQSENENKHTHNSQRQRGTPTRELQAQHRATDIQNIIPYCWCLGEKKSCRGKERKEAHYQTHSQLHGASEDHRMVHLPSIKVADLTWYPCRFLESGWEELVPMDPLRINKKRTVRDLVARLKELGWSLGPKVQSCKFRSVPSTIHWAERQHSWLSGVGKSHERDNFGDERSLRWMRSHDVRKSLHVHSYVYVEEAKLSTPTFSGIASLFFYGKLPKRLESFYGTP